MLAPRPRQQAEGPIRRSRPLHLRVHNGRNRDGVKASPKCGQRVSIEPPLRHRPLVEKSKGSALLPPALCETSSLAIWHRRAIEVVRDATAAPRCSRPTMPHGFPAHSNIGRIRRAAFVRSTLNCGCDGATPRLRVQLGPSEQETAISEMGFDGQFA
jgi:hypothetical protein